MKNFYRLQDAVLLLVMFIGVPALVMWYIDRASTPNREVCVEWCVEQGGTLAAMSGPDPLVCHCFYSHGE